MAGPAAASSALSPSQVRAQQWWISRLGLRQMWQLSEGQNTTVAVLDEGVKPNFDGTPSDLTGALVPGFGVGIGGNGLHSDDPTDHGASMADDIAGRGTGFGLLGVARRASILSVEIPHLSNANTAAALTRLAAMSTPPAVVNMAYGTPGACPADVQDAVRAAAAKGMILVASAGNDGYTGNQSQTPANCIGVVAVGAVQDDNTAAPWAGTQRQPYVALAAPGVHIIGHDSQAASGYGYADGTSDATAIVSGTFAVVRAHFPQLSSRDVVTRVLATAHQFGARVRPSGARPVVIGIEAAR